MKCGCSYSWWAMEPVVWPSIKRAMWSRGVAFGQWLHVACRRGGRTSVADRRRRWDGSFVVFGGNNWQRWGADPVFLLGARSGNDLLQLDLFARYGEVYLTTEDGSRGERGYVTLHSVLSQKVFTRLYSCGPKPMMVAVARFAKNRGIDCEVSLENRMACGVGACLCCVENTTEGHLCVCKEGPVFNINKLLWQI